MKTPYDIIRKPVMTEKSYDALMTRKYTFLVDPKANKHEIKQAIETIFGVKVDKVNTLRQHGKVKRQGIHSGLTPETKKAFVTLKPDSKGIEFFDNLAQ